MIKPNTIKPSHFSYGWTWQKMKIPALIHCPVVSIGVFPSHSCQGGVSFCVGHIHLWYVQMVIETTL